MKRVLLLALATAAGESATAQNMGWSSVLPSMAGTDTLGLALRQHMQRGPDAAARGAPGANPGASAASASLRYTPTAARRRANLAQFVARSRSVDPAGCRAPGTALRRRGHHRADRRRDRAARAQGR